MRPLPCGDIATAPLLAGTDRRWPAPPPPHERARFDHSEKPVRDLARERAKHSPRAAGNGGEATARRTGHTQGGDRRFGLRPASARTSAPGRRSPPGRFRF